MYDFLAVQFLGARATSFCRQQQIFANTPSKHRLLSATPLAAPLRADLSLSSIMSYCYHLLVPWRCAQVDVKSLSRSLAPRHGLVSVHEQHRVESLRGHGEAATMRPSGFKLCKYMAVFLALACSVLFLFTINLSWLLGLQPSFPFPSPLILLLLLDSKRLVLGPIRPVGSRRVHLGFMFALGPHCSRLWRPGWTRLPRVFKY